MFWNFIRFWDLEAEAMELASIQDGKFVPVAVSDNEKGLSPAADDVPEEIRQGYTDHDKHDMARMGEP